MESNIRRLRLGRNMKQTELAEILGVSQQIISRMENNREKIHVKNLIMLADYFQVSTDTILDYQVKTETNRSNIWLQTDVLQKKETSTVYDALVNLKRCLEECGV